MERKTRKRLFIGLGCPLSLVILAVLISEALIPGAGRVVTWFVMKDEPQESHDYLEYILNTEAGIREDDLTIVPYSEEILALSMAFVSAWEHLEPEVNSVIEKHGNFDFATGGGYRPGREELPDCSDFIQAWTDIVTHPEYDIDCLIASVTHQNWELPKIGPAAMKNMCIPLQWEAARLAEEGRFEDAMEMAEMLSLAGKAVPFARIGSWTAAARCSEYSVELALYLSGFLEADDERLSVVEKTIRSWRADFPFFQRTHAAELTSLGAYIEVRRRGCEVPFEIITIADAIALEFRSWAIYLEEKLLPLATGNAATEARIRKDVTSGMIATYCADPDRYPKFSKERVIGHLVRFLLAITGPKMSERVARPQNAVLSRMILIHLTLAQRIREAETGRPLESLEELVPEYIETVPEDPHAPPGTPLGLDRLPYSLGFDGTDDMAQIRYDPTNGGTSRGDIFYPFGAGERVGSN